MFAVYTFSAAMGAVFAVLPWLGLAPEPAQGDETSEEPPPLAAGSTPLWALGLLGFGLVGLTLDLSGRDFWPTLAAGFCAGIPAGLLAGWISRRIARR